MLVKGSLFWPFNEILDKTNHFILLYSSGSVLVKSFKGDFKSLFIIFTQVFDQEDFDFVLVEVSRSVFIVDSPNAINNSLNLSSCISTLNSSKSFNEVKLIFLRLFLCLFLNHCFECCLFFVESFLLFYFSIRINLCL